MAKYKVLRGSHQIMTSEVPEGGGVPQVSATMYRVGDVFEVPEGRNYDSRMTHVRFKRLLRVPDDTPVKNSPPPEPKETTVQLGELEPKLEGVLTDQLVGITQGMTVPELRELAADHKIDLTGATKRDDILKCLRDRA